MAFRTVKPLEKSGRFMNGKAKPVSSVERGFDVFRMAGDLPIGALDVKEGSHYATCADADRSSFQWSDPLVIYHLTFLICHLNKFKMH